MITKGYSDATKACSLIDRKHVMSSTGEVNVLSELTNNLNTGYVNQEELRGGFVWTFELSIDFYDLTTETTRTTEKIHDL